MEYADRKDPDQLIIASALPAYRIAEYYIEKALIRLRGGH